MSIKVSVIIPVYNAGEYIRECIESLLNQTLKQCEYIFINDGSTDKSEQIINEYLNKDSRIRIINQDNKGVSAARNAGLSIAVGEFIGFVDADDFIEVDMYERLYEAAEKSECDLVFSNFESEIGSHKVITKYPFPSNVLLDKRFINYTLFPYHIKEDNLNTVWNKIFKNKLIKENNLTFPLGVDLGEDGMFNLSFLNQTGSLVYLDYTGYHYREVTGSATRNIVKKNYFQRSIDVYHSELPEYIRKLMDSETIKQLKSNKLIKSTFSYIHIYFHPTPEVPFLKRYVYIQEMIKNKYVQEALSYYYKANHKQLSNYEKVIVYSMKKRLTLALYLVTAYSRARNK